MFDNQPIPPPKRKGPFFFNSVTGKKYRPASTNNKKHPNGYLTPLLKKLLQKKISITDPVTLKKIQSDVKHAVLWRLLLNATEGETSAIKEILDRVDGRVAQEVVGTGFNQTNHFYVQNIIDKVQNIQVNNDAAQVDSFGKLVEPEST